MLTFLKIKDHLNLSKIAPNQQKQVSLQSSDSPRYLCGTVRRSMQNDLGAAQQLEPNVLIVILIRRLMIGGVLGPQNEKIYF